MIGRLPATFGGIVHDRQVIQDQRCGVDHLDGTGNVEGARAAMADFLNAETPDEIIFGQNMTTLTLHMSRSIGRLFQRGDEIILGDNSHTFYSEQGGSAAIAGIHPRTLTNQPDGKLALKDIEASIRPDDIHNPHSQLIVLENTHNRKNGSPLDVAYMRSVRDLADKYNLKIHIDGARLFNAAIALGVDARDLVADADSVSFCLSKGLAAPVGSVICGSGEFIIKARRARKLVGGGMRQAGVLAAAGVVALTEMTDRLAEDHANARQRF